MRIVFVGGSQRSGTTLVQTLIANALPNVPILPEAHIICDLMGAFRHAKAAWSKTSLYYEDHESLARYFRSAVEAHVTDIERRYGKLEFLVLKDPSFIRFMPELTESFPDAAQIMCVRDPRDIVASYIKIGHRQRNKNRTTRYTKRRILPICRKINAAYQPLIDEPAQPGRILVRYEELVLRPGRDFASAFQHYWASPKAQ